jgi:hypothetical protein
MVNGQDPVHAAIPPGRTAGRTAAGLPSPRLAFTGRFRAGKAGRFPRDWPNLWLARTMRTRWLSWTTGWTAFWMRITELEAALTETLIAFYRGVFDAGNTRRGWTRVTCCGASPRILRPHLGDHPDRAADKSFLLSHDSADPGQPGASGNSGTVQ